MSGIEAGPNQTFQQEEKEMSVLKFPLGEMAEKLTLTDLVSKANEKRLSNVAIIGANEDGESFIFSNYTDYAELLYLLRMIDAEVFARSRE